MVKICVTSEDIESGAVNSPSMCPVARAIRRHINVPIMVSQTRIANNLSEFKMPRSVARFVYRFDHYKQVKPFCFLLKEK